jgi:predicted patatin/cPLA2 family phospholipase
MESQKNKHKNALIVEGGAMRGIFSAGILDAFLLAGFDPFDLCIGVSAGAGNIAAFLGEMYQRNYKIYTDYSIRPEFINWKRFLGGGHLLDLDWMWAMTIREIRLDLEKIFSKKKEFIIVATSVSTGEARYLKPDADTCEDYLKASSSLPILYRYFPQVGSEMMTDGGIADSIPVIEAYRRGARNFMVLRSRRSDYVKKNEITTKIYALFLRKYPNLSIAMQNRAASYMRAVTFIKNPPEDARVVEVSPPGSFQTSRLTNNVDVLKADYRTGMELGKTAIERWNAMI